MKRNILALAVGAAIALPGVALADAATVYGRMDMSLDYVDIDNDLGTDNDSGSNWAVSSNASRFGVKGDADLGNGLTALYKMEWQVSGDEGSYSTTVSGVADDNGDDVDDFEVSTGDLKARNRYVGISGGFGTVVLGMMDTPLKKSQGKFDQFDNHAADIGSFASGEVRAQNIIQYSSPKIADMITGTIAFQPGEENESELDECTGDVNDAEDCYDSLSDAFSASVVAETGNFYGALAFDSNMNSMDVVRLVGVMKIRHLQLGALLQTAEANDDAVQDNAPEVKNSTIAFSGAMMVGKTKLKGQLGRTTVDLDIDGVDDADFTLIAVGAEHQFTKQTQVYAEYTNLSVDADSNDPTRSQLSMGIQHKF